MNVLQEWKRKHEGNHSTISPTIAPTVLDRLAPSAPHFSPMDAWRQKQGSAANRSPPGGVRPVHGAQMNDATSRPDALSPAGGDLPVSSLGLWHSKFIHSRLGSSTDVSPGDHTTANTLSTCESPARVNQQTVGGCNKGEDCSVTCSGAVAAQTREDGGDEVDATRVLEPKDFDNATDVLASVYPHLACSMRSFQPDVPIIMVAEGAAQDGETEEDDDDDEAAFQPLADSMAEVLADSERRIKKKDDRRPSKVAEGTYYSIEAYVVPGLGTSRATVRGDVTCPATVAHCFSLAF